MTKAEWLTFGLLLAAVVSGGVYVGSLQSDVSTLKEDLGSLTSAVETLQGQVTGLSSSTIDLDDRASVLKTTSDNMEVQVKALASEFRDARAALSTPRITDPYNWSSGQRVRMITSDEGYCFLTTVGGDFGGDGDRVRVRVVDGSWYMEGAADPGSNTIDAAARCWMAPAAP